MSAVSNTGTIFKAIPEGLPNPDVHFEVIHRTIDIKNLKLDENDFILRNLYLSLDPYVRLTMREPQIDSYMPSNLIGHIMSGIGVSEVVKSNNPNHKVGDLVYGFIGWEEYTHIKTDAKSTNDYHFKNINYHKKLLKEIPLSYQVSLLQFSGLTSYGALMLLGKPKAGETIYISCAAGATGNLVGQIAKIKGLKVVGSTGTDEKVNFLLNDLKFDAAFNYKKVDLDKTLSELCPNGIDIYFENVGGETLDVVLKHCNRFARIPVCGMISQYNITNPKEKYGIKNLELTFHKSICFHGFLATDFIGSQVEKDFEKDMLEWVKSGKIICKENNILGIENAGKGFTDMLVGNNVGKSIVKIADY
ncbi:11064_t:CDS:2 [Funneliformis geosporum]|uniref:3529_t:CDS:1 n=1 Tax=Funneliformis geosporum TaxID=1117311 RepID=A0A9W4SEI1_9GLOM|nr:11064_t:CDS:2 [Funneliformis geosporum]CAI2166508.1 3529_t:CDS:2 [Funneliformis geosporum]